MPKVESAEMAIDALNPDVKVITHQTRLDKENVLDIFARLRHHPGRHRQLRDPLPDQRRLRAAR